METSQYAECGSISIALAILPTIGLIISEILPYISKSDKCNGLLQTLICAIKHIVNKEPCSSEDIQQVIQNFTPTNSPRNLTETNNFHAGETPLNSPVDNDLV